MDNKELTLFIAQTIDAKKGMDVTILDIGEKSGFADYFVIATANNLRLLEALCDEIEDRMAEKDRIVKHIEGKGNSGWILMDYGDIIVNLFTPEQREHYGIERIWKDCSEIEFIPAAE